MANDLSCRKTIWSNPIHPLNIPSLHGTRERSRPPNVKMFFGNLKKSGFEFWQFIEGGISILTQYRAELTKFLELRLP